MGLLENKWNSLGGLSADFRDECRAI